MMKRNNCLLYVLFIDFSYFRAFEKRLSEELNRSPVQSFNQEHEQQRKALGGLKKHGKKGTVGVNRTGSATQCKC